MSQKPVPETERVGGATSPTIGDVVTVDVGAPVAGGQCISRRDGQVIFVRDAVPGERVAVQITGSGKKGAFLRGEVREVFEPSPHRVQAPCSLAQECGGCDWQHVDLGFQRELKAAVIIDALQRTGGVSEIAGIPLTASVRVEALDDGDGLHWRTRMRFAVDGDGTIGLRAGRSHRIIPAADCPLAVPEIAAAIPANLTQKDRRHFKDGVVAVASNTGQVELVGASAVDLLTERVMNREFQVAANGFWQVHPRAPETLVNTVLELAEPKHGDKVIDLYSGVGLFAAFLAEAVGVTGRVDAVEGDRIASRLAKDNLHDLAWVHHHHAPVEKWLGAGHRSHADVVVLDPPRAGAGDVVVKAVTRRKPRAIVYIACDPVSLARDTKYLAGFGYSLTHLRAFDLFPMTKHVESVALFARD